MRKLMVAAGERGESIVRVVETDLRTKKGKCLVESKLINEEEPIESRGLDCNANMCLRNK